MPRLRDSVVESILGLVQEMALAPGDALPTERDLSTRLGVSRNVIRQSFDLLEERGLVSSRRGSGRFLRTVEDESGVGHGDPGLLEIASIADILETRAILEEQTVALACQRRTAGELRELVQLGGQLQSWEDNARFHVALAAATHNFMLERLVRQQIELSDQLHQRQKYADPAELDHMRAEHVAMVQAVGSRDATRARELMRRHLSGAHRAVTEDAWQR